jgi:hypothetical protein
MFSFAHSTFLYVPYEDDFTYFLAGMRYSMRRNPDPIFFLICWIRILFSILGALASLHCSLLLTCVVFLGGRVTVMS